MVILVPVVPLLDMRKEVIQKDNCNPEIIKSHFDEMIKRGILESVPPIHGSVEKLTTGVIPCIAENGTNNEEKPNDSSIRDAAALKRKASSLCEEEVRVND